MPVCEKFSPVWAFPPWPAIATAISLRLWVSPKSSARKSLRMPPTIPARNRSTISSPTIFVCTKRPSLAIPMNWRIPVFTGSAKEPNFTPARPKLSAGFMPMCVPPEPRPTQHLKSWRNSKVRSSCVICSTLFRTHLLRWMKSSLSSPSSSVSAPRPCLLARSARKRTAPSRSQ